MVVAGVIGYPAKKLHPAAAAPQPMASLPSKSEYAIQNLLKKKPLVSE
jgi:hypothetical protein